MNLSSVETAQELQFVSVSSAEERPVLENEHATSIFFFFRREFIKKNRNMRWNQAKSLYINARVCLSVCLSSIEMDIEALIKKTKTSFGINSLRSN